MAIKTAPGKRKNNDVKIIHSRKLQSALEYLMTYGWVILFIVIAMTILYEFGIFNPSSVITSTPIITGFNGLSIVSPAANQTMLKFSLMDNIGLPIELTAINFTQGSAHYSKVSCQSNYLQAGGLTTCYFNATFPSTVFVSMSISYLELTGFSSNPELESGSILMQRTNGFVLPPANSPQQTNFIESGLPNNASWSILVNNSFYTSKGGFLRISLPPGNFSSILEPVYMSPPSSGCKSNSVYYVPTINISRIDSGSSYSFSYTKRTGTVCTTTVSETGLPLGYKWYSLYGFDFNYTTTNRLEFTTLSSKWLYFGLPIFMQLNSSCSRTYTESPLLSFLSAGNSKAIVFLNSTVC